MTAATPAPPPRDHHDGQVHRAFTGWAEAEGYDDVGSYHQDQLAEAFAAGWEAADAVVAQAEPGDVEAAFASGARVRTGPCPVAAHDREHFQVRTGGHWLCGHLLARMLIAQGIAADPLAAAAPPIGTAWRLLDETRNRLAIAGAERDDARSRVADAVAKSDRLEGQNEDLRSLVTVIIDEVSGWSRDPLDTDQLIADWREYAGIDQS